MNTAFIGIASALIAVSSYIAKYSLFKDISKAGINRFRLNSYYRLIGVPIILVFLLIGGGNFGISNSLFWVFLAICTFLNILYGYLQVKVYQTIDFSTVSLSRPLDVIFSFIFGALFMNEVINQRHIAGILLIAVSYILFYYKAFRNQTSAGSISPLVTYNLLGALVSVGNKYAIMYSSPQLYALFMSATLFVTNYLLSYKDSGLTGGIAKSTIRPILLISLVSALGFVAVNYAFKYLYVGVVTAILATEPFLGLVVSKVRYKEKDLLPKFLALLLAFVGIVVMVVL